MSDIFREEADQARRVRELIRRKRESGTAPAPDRAEGPDVTAEPKASSDAAPERITEAGPPETTSDMEVAASPDARSTVAALEPGLAAVPEAESPEPDQRRGGAGDMRLAFVLLAVLAALWLSYDFNDRLAEALPTLRPLLEQYHAFVTNLIG